MIEVMHNGARREAPEAVFFPFDTFNVPLHAGVEVELVTAIKRVRPVLAKGEVGAADEHNLRFYGSVIEIDGQYHIWYLGGGGPEERWVGDFPAWCPKGICHAVSADGVHWEKPNHELVEYNGNRHNNLVDLDCANVATCVVLHEPDDPDPNRRFKMVFESTKYQQRLAVAFSPDGLRWQESKHNPVLPYGLEMSGVIRLGDCYYCNGQAVNKPARMLCTVMSYDFENWTSATNVGHRRDDIPGRPAAMWPGIHDGPQVHLGASLWDRGNTILGFYGIWNNPTSDRRSVYMDLGLLVTIDALHYHEPVRDFPIVRAGEERDGATPALMQGQAFANIDDRTCYWFSAWREGDVRLAEWPRDRLGYARPNADPKIETPHLWTSPLRSTSGVLKVFLNVEGISAPHGVAVAVTDERFVPLDGFDAGDCGGVKNGLRSKVRWRGGQTVPTTGPVRLRIDFTEPRGSDARLFAVYVESANA